MSGYQLRLNNGMVSRPLSKVHEDYMTVAHMRLEYIAFLQFLYDDRIERGDSVYPLYEEECVEIVAIGKPIPYAGNIKW